MDASSVQPAAGARAIQAAHPAARTFNTGLTVTERGDKDARPEEFGGGGGAQ
jgi:hypothetical protein